jgi:kynureninase
VVKAEVANAAANKHKQDFLKSMVFPFAQKFEGPKDSVWFDARSIGLRCQASLAKSRRIVGGESVG